MSQDEMRRLDTELNEMTGRGEIIAGLDAFYCDDCTFREGNEAPIVGKAAQKTRLEAMFATLKGFNGATLHSQAIGEGVTLTEWTFDMTGGDGESIVWNEVLVRRWKDGKVVQERFYQA